MSCYYRLPVVEKCLDKCLDVQGIHLQEGQSFLRCYKFSNNFLYTFFEQFFIDPVFVTIFIPARQVFYFFEAARRFWLTKCKHWHFNTRCICCCDSSKATSMPLIEYWATYILAAYEKNEPNFHCKVLQVYTLIKSLEE